ncbi:hypothetical protein CFAM422_003050 [Trichoderma lentiforme]|uniref:Uncharacterized protein n=1 Tax=Trichoderma lentiforme TaxID=1567552 RepID=A0A9P4XLF4_9HYPO|nr:hypothetical protein CFAM422_003050 [Trichoderma lentiforme]
MLRRGDSDRAASNGSSKRTDKDSTSKRVNSHAALSWIPGVGQSAANNGHGRTAKDTARKFVGSDGVDIVYRAATKMLNMTKTKSPVNTGPLSWIAS